MQNLSVKAGIEAEKAAVKAEKDTKEKEDENASKRNQMDLSQILRRLPNQKSNRDQRLMF